MSNMRFRLFRFHFLLSAILGYSCAVVGAANPKGAPQEKPSWIPKISVYQPPAVEKSTSPVFRTVDPQIIQKLINLLDENNLGKLEDVDQKTAGDFSQQQSLKEIITYVTPEGFRLSNRYTRLGVALSESLGWEQVKHIRVISEQNLKQRLTTVARWDNTPNVRSIALIALASLKDKNDIVYFQEALWSRNIGIRYATIEALVNWGFPEAVPILQTLLAKDESYLIRTVAAGALARLGQPEGLKALRDNMQNKDWLVRMLSAKFLGEEGDVSDYDLLTNQLDRETTMDSNDFVATEISISALKLFPKKLEFDKLEKERKKRKGQPAPEPVAQAPAAVKPKANVLLELAPLVVTAPRLKIPKYEPVDPRVNFRLLKILRQNADIQLTSEQIAKSNAYRDMNQLATPSGMLLKTRYTKLGYLLTEGLAGSKEFEIQDELIRISRESKDPNVKSFALISLAYCQDPNHLYIFQDALRSETAADRFAAVEALQIWGQREALPILNGVVKLDRSPIIRVYASQAIFRLGDPIGKDYLTRSLDDNDWVAKAMSMRYIGELGDANDYSKVLSYLAADLKPIVQAEMCSTLLRLYAKKYEKDQKELNEGK